MPGLGHGFVTRVPGVRVDVEREEAIAGLRDHWMTCVGELGFRESGLRMAEQVHGNGIAMVSEETGGMRAEGCDGLITATPGIALGILVADCCAIYVVDPICRACGLFHSGRKGTELGIATRGIGAMQEAFGSDPEDLTIRLSPCIRPPDYEVDFAAEIRRQCLAAGVRAANLRDDGVSTARALDRYYSYRVEKGKTGRMLALLGWV